MEKTGQTLNEKFEAERFYLGEGPNAMAMVKASDYDNLLDAFLNNCGLDDLQVIETIASAAARRMYDRLETVTSNLPASYRVYAFKVFAEEFKKCVARLS